MMQVERERLSLIKAQKNRCQQHRTLCS